MSDAFWANLPLLITALGVAFPAILGAIWAKRSVKATEEGNKASLEAVKKATQEIKQDVRTDASTVDTLKTGAFREGFVAGQEQAKTDFGALHKE